MRCASSRRGMSCRLPSVPPAASRDDMTQRWVAAVTGAVRADGAGVPDETHRELARPASARIRVALALGSGALLAASFAPLDFWPLAILCPAVLMWLWQGATPREAAWLGFWL